MTQKKTASTLRVSLAQTDFDLGHIEENTRRIIETTRQAVSEYQSDLVIFPELTLTGYPPEDLLLRPGLYRHIDEAIETLTNTIQDTSIIIGFPQKTQAGLFNAACVISAGKVIATYQKRYLPNYSVFDEKRYFMRGNSTCVFTLHGVPIGLTICEDLWRVGTLKENIDAGAKILVSINASPFHLTKADMRKDMLIKRQKEEGRIPILYAHWAAGQDELVFDGGSMIINEESHICYQANFFEPDLIHSSLNINKTPSIKACKTIPSLSLEEKAYQALTLGVRDYVHKNRFSGAIIGLSGGIDSALTLAIAVDALGNDNVTAVMMPSQYTSAMSIEDATTIANNLGVKLETISIETLFKAFLNELNPLFSNLPVDTAEENIQARCRGVLLMALSNKFHRIILTTGNKSELAVGYATLYGDMAGGFAVLKDVWKTLVTKLTLYRNTLSPVIPNRVIERAPSAELRENQTDQDSLPEYSILDQILQLYIEEDKDVEEIANRGFDKQIIQQVVKLVYQNEYKRRQAPPGVRITQRAFGKDRRYPITTGYYQDTDN